MENKIKEESGLKFLFPQNDTVVKFDDTKYNGYSCQCGRSRQSGY